MKVLLLLLVTLVFSAVKGDTLASCLFEDIVGTWNFVESARNGDHNIICNDEVEFTERRTIKLEYPNTATDELGYKGTWTMIVNQGFEVNIDGRSYFAFFMYKITSTGGLLPTIVSYCNETFTGWSRDKTVRNWSCFQGQKLQSVPLRTGYSTPSLPTRRFINDQALINKINSVQSLWKAKAYPEHEKYTLKDMFRRAGGSAGVIPRQISPAPATEEQKARASLLPENFDWRDVDEVNYVSPVRDQGACGSCYAFASMGSLEARIRILTNNERQDIFSVQDVVDCSYLSQGCDGGFNYPIGGRYAQDQGVIPDEYDPYVAHDQTCVRNTSAPLTYVSDYEYVGGFYGACNEELMREALIAGGPMAVAYMVYDDFFNYDGGIYKHTDLRSDFNPLVPANHAVVIVGYGVDESSGEKYWSVKNSWGTSWGVNGYFNILRGTNECGIESAAFAPTPIQ